MVTPDQIQKSYFESSVSRVLSEGHLSKEVIDLVPETLSKTFFDVRNELQIDYLINIRPSNLITDAYHIRRRPPGIISMAHFEPTILDGKVVRGELVLDRHVLMGYSKMIERRGGAKPFTPWKLMSDVAHELRHADQCQRDIAGVLEDLKRPYEAQIGELDANQYTRDYISRVKPRGLFDRLERAWVLHDLKEDVSTITKTRHQLGLSD